ncbi:hypothetical protein GCM10023063_06010 [Arthrobacter methylotrophus]
MGPKGERASIGVEGGSTALSSTDARARMLGPDPTLAHVCGQFLPRRTRWADECPKLGWC